MEEKLITFFKHNNRDSKEIYKLLINMIQQVSFFVWQENRIKYNQQHYMKVFNDEESVKMLMDSVEEPSLLVLVEVSSLTTATYGDGEGEGTVPPFLIYNDNYMYVLDKRYIG